MVVPLVQTGKLDAMVFIPCGMDLWWKSIGMVPINVHSMYS